MAKQLVGLLSQPLFVDTSATTIDVLCSGYYALANEEEEEDDDEEEGNTAASRAADPFLDDSTGQRPHAAAAAGPTDATARRHLLHKDALESDGYYLSFSDPVWNPHRYHNISQGYAKHVCEAVFGKYSVNIMPKLCNVFEHHPSTAVLQAIQSFSKVCKAEVMTNILKGILEVGQSIAAEEGDARALGLPRGKAGDAPLTSKRRMVLDIACAVVAQLPPAYILALFNDIVEPVLMDPAPESRLLQKKAYKLLFSMFEHRVRDIFPFFPRIVGLLSVGRQHVTISGIKMRLKCLSWALDACKMYYPDQVVSTITSLLGEIIIFSRELSSDTRIMAMDVLEKMQHYMTQAGAPANALLRLAVAGLSGKTPQMISSAVVCLAKIVYLVHEQIPQSDLDASVRLCFQLMESTHAEVRSAASIFARMALKLSKRSPAVHTAVEHGLQKLLFAVALITSQPHVPSKTRTQMRVLVEKCIQRFSIEHLENIFPIGSRNFLRYCNKMMRREEKKAERELARRDKREANEFDKLFLGAGMEAGDADAAEEDLLAAGALNSFVSKHTTPHMLGPKRRQADGAGEDGDDEDDTMHLDVQQDGKLRLLSTEEKKREDDTRERQAMVQRLLGRAKPMTNADAINESAQSRPGKRGRVEAEDLENDELVRRFGTRTADEAAKKASEAFNRRHPATVGGADGAPAAADARLAKDWYRKAERREEKRVRVEEDVRKGEEFKGTGAGDIRKGNIEPYAYVPLNRRYMNRRNARQAVHRFQIVSHKQLKGEKAKALDAINKKKRKK
ncbi:ribosomal rRNA-processing protein 12 [Strigomonas culicis]|nr:ribosomal rRNA-processing protein 12 [Strigomonas culicis]|eukprot:EPY30587.1 ribosomal rRNA-processing protein 12 [Strigomonas culicis]